MAYKWDQILTSLASPGMILQVGNPYKPSLYITLSWTNSSPLKIDRPRRKVVSQPSIFRGYVCFREGTNPKLPCKVAACYPLLMTPGGPGFSPRLFEGEDREVVLGEATDSSTKNSTPTWDFRKDIQKDAWENVSYINIYIYTFKQRVMLGIYLKFQRYFTRTGFLTAIHLFSFCWWFLCQKLQTSWLLENHLIFSQCDPVIPVKRSWNLIKSS